MARPILRPIVRLAVLLLAASSSLSAIAQSSPVTISPPSFDVGSLFENQHANATFLIKNVSSGDIFLTWSYHGGVPLNGFICAEPELGNRLPTFLHPGETCTQSVYIGPNNGIPAGAVGPGQTIIDYSINNGEATLSRTVTWNVLPPPVALSPNPIDMGTAQVGQTVTRVVTLRNTTASATSIGVQLQQAQKTDCDPLFKQPGPPTIPIPNPICIKQMLAGGTSLAMDVVGCTFVAPNSSCTVSLEYTPSIALPTAGDLLIYIGAFQATVPIKTAAAPVRTHSGAVLAVEFVDRDRLHFFVTAMQSEIDALDSGQFPPWIRTGRIFWVYPPGDPLVANESPVCRYFTTPTSGLSTHFYSAFPQECAAIPTLFPGIWTLETTDAFGVRQPNVATGQCPFGTSPLYRLYNGGPDVNHRYVTDPDTRQLMAGNYGWIPEGYGPLGVGMCLPQ
jgi:hypothetical protein